MTLADNIAEKADRLVAILRSFADGVAVAFSGGIDSTVVAKAAVLALGDKAVAVTADSPSVPRNEIAEAKRIACEIGIRHVIVATAEFDNPDYQRNDGSRCYHCKSELYDQIIARLPSLGVDVVCSGANLDDLGDYRPGLVAAAERYVRHPLQEAGFTKTDVRAAAHSLELADVGQAGVAVPVEPACSGTGGDAGTDRACRGRGGVSELARIARMPGSIARRRAGADRSTIGKRRAPRRAGDAIESEPPTPRIGLSIRHARSGGISQRQHE